LIEVNFGDLVPEQGRYLDAIYDYLEALKLVPGLDEQVNRAENFLKEAEGLLEWTVAKSKFAEVGANGGTILSELIKNGILEDISSTEVRLKVVLDDKIEQLVKDIAKTDFDKIWSILQSSKEKDLDRADWLLTQISWLPNDIQEKKPGVRSGLVDFFWGLIGTEATLQAGAFYLFFPLQFLYDWLIKRGETQENYQKAVNMPSLNPEDFSNQNPQPQPADSAMIAQPIAAQPVAETTILSVSMAALLAMVSQAQLSSSGINRASSANVPARASKPRSPALRRRNMDASKTTGGINLSHTKIVVKSSGDLIQMTFDDPAMLRLLLNSDGLTPIINDVKIMTPAMKAQFLGLN
jgi:hypothetical protein